MLKQKLIITEYDSTSEGNDCEIESASSLNFHNVPSQSYTSPQKIKEKSLKVTKTKLNLPLLIQKMTLNLSNFEAMQVLCKIRRNINT